MKTSGPLTSHKETSFMLKESGNQGKTVNDLRPDDAVPFDGKEVFGSPPSNLEVEAALSNEELEKVPSALFKHLDLNVLLLSNNLLQSLPEEISTFSHLHTIDVSNNLIAQLPSSITKCNSLRQLYLDRNQIKELPADFGQLRLEKLSLEENPIRKLPHSIFDLPSSLTISLEGHKMDTKTILELQCEIDNRKKTPKFLFIDL